MSANKNGDREIDQTGLMTGLDDFSHLVERRERPND